MFPPTASDASEVDPSRRRLLTGLGAAAAGAGVLALAGTTPAHAETTNGTYFTYGPNRVVDTRLDGGRISAGQTRSFDILGGPGITFVINVTVTATLGSGFLALYDADLTVRPLFSTANWLASGATVANLTFVDVGAAGFKVYCGGAGSTHFVLDTLGYMYTTTSNRTEEQIAREREWTRRIEARKSR